jgi:hypothetical protein
VKRNNEKKHPNENLINFEKLKTKNMQQVYHLNTETNIHIRRQIKESSLTNFQLA